MRSIDSGAQKRVWAIVQDISVRKLAEQELERAALTDSLTGPANRPAFVHALEAAVARYRAHPSTRYSVLQLDFDRFKFVNDTLGHAADDLLLQHIGERLLTSLAEPYALLGRQIHSSASIGVFVASDPALSADAVMQQADLAMCEAIRHGDLNVAHQPIVDLQSGRIAAPRRWCAGRVRRSAWSRRPSSCRSPRMRT